MKHAIRNTIYAILVAFLLAGCARQEAPVDIAVSARSAIIMDKASGELLFGKNIDTRYPPASTVKIMTAIIAIENAPLDKKIVPSRDIQKVEPIIAGLKPGVEYRMKDLIAAILIHSANDAAVAIAEGVSGSEDKFAELMNRKAREIGMDDTYFANASGLPTGKKDRQYSTASDQVKMMKYALRYKIITGLLSKKNAAIYGNDGKRIELKTKNKALLRFKRAPWGKTGYTHEARRTFVGIDPSTRPVIILAVMKSDDLWSDIMKLEEAGIEMYHQRHRGPVQHLVKWIKEQRRPLHRVGI
ncbi:MAG: serine hydrolase [Candidatus Omnitrophota bacterium]